jgi:CubicO group peptidase (beta-lactamase class C family)
VDAAHPSGQIMPEVSLTIREAIMSSAVRLFAWTLSISAAACTPQVEPGWPTEGWVTSVPEAQGLDPAPLAALHEGIEAGNFGYVDRLVVVTNGFLVVSERYDNDYRDISRGRRGALGCGTDSCEAWSGPPEFNYYDPDRHPWYQDREVHTLQSVTKSVTSALIGIAIEHGAIAGTDAPLLSFLHEYDLSRVDARLHDASLDDLLTMRSGIEWHEVDRPADSTNTTFQLEWSRDWVQFTLDQPMDADPGAKWAYNSGGSHLMSVIVRTATDETADLYAERHLFGPLGIDDYYWKKTPRGLPDTEGGLYLEAEQLAKIGYLYLHDGMWAGQRILPEGWVETSVARHVDSVNDAGFGYGYQWWRPDRNDVVVWAGLGFGGQYLLVLPQLQTVAVMNAWNIFGGQRQSALNALLDALLAAAGQTQ